MHVRGGARMCMLIPAPPLFLWHLRGSRGAISRKSPYARGKPEAASDGVTSKHLAGVGISNRNAAHALRDRIFLHRRHQIFVVSTLQPRTTALGTGLESSDSAQVSRIVGRQIEPRFDFAIGALGKADRAGLGDTLQPRSDIHAVAHKVAVGLLNDIAQMDSSVKFDALFWPYPGVALG
jgi:hypothetical protein